MNPYLESLIEIAKSKDGEYVSGEYATNKSMIKWKCKNGHIFEQRAMKTRCGQWCAYCIGKNRTFDFVLKVAKERDGEVLDTEYFGNDYYYTWKCNKDGYIWKARLTNVLHSGSRETGQWCPKCGGNARGTIEKMHEFAKSKGWQCLSNKYESVHARLQWQCQYNHQWFGSANNIVNKGRGCPKCNVWKIEENCRAIFENIFKKPFIKTRNALGCRLELDGYNEELKLAFEYNGEQHYHVSLWFNGTQAILDRIMFNDKRKLQLCKDKGIKLIVIPYWESKKLEEFIKEQFQVFV